MLTNLKIVKPDAVISSFFASYDAMNEYCGDRNVYRKLSSVDRRKWKINFDKPEIHICKNLTVSAD